MHRVASSEAHEVLTVNHGATLTIATNSLIVLDERLQRRRCFGFFSTPSQYSIPFRNILWAATDDESITIEYVKPKGKACKVATIHYNLGNKIDQDARSWTDALLDRAYPNHVQRRKRIKVLINPFGGQGYANTIWSQQVEPVLAAARCVLDVEATTHRGHASEIVEALDVDKYDIIASASGDGLPHEVLNGLAQQEQPMRALKKIAVAQIPCGSGNAMSMNLLGTSVPSWAAVEIVKGVPMPLDLVAITQGTNMFYSFLSQAVGVVAESDLGTESLRWMGSLRFTWGIMIRIFGKTIYPAEVSIATEVQNKDEIKRRYRAELAERLARDPPNVSNDNSADNALPALRYGTVNDPVPTTFTTVDYPKLGNFYVGNMPFMAPDVQFFPMSLPDDGLADLVMIPGDISRLISLKLLMTVEQGTVIDPPVADYRKITGYRIVPRNPFAEKQGLRHRFVQWLAGAGSQTEGLIAIDGEKMPFEPFQAEVQRGLATAISRSGVAYEKRPVGY